MLNVDPLIGISALLAMALVGGMIAHRLKQPIILGYLVIGIIAGPYAFGLVKNVALVETAASVGVALLMFTMGLEISLSQLRDVGKIGIWGGTVQILMTLILGTAAGAFIFQWPLAQSILFGLIISLSSTAVCLKILMDRGDLSSVHGRIMISFLIFQDISVVAMMIILPLMHGNMTDLWMELGLAAGKAALFIGFAIVLGRWALPWLFGNIGGVRSRELFLLTILVLCLGATAGTQFLGLSMVFGAFLVGIVLRSTRFVHQALAEITPLRDIFATLFFVSIGMLLDPAFLFNNWPAVLTLVAIIMVIKLTVVFFVVKSFGYNNRIAAFTSAGLFQLGEFSFVLAQGGLNENIVSQYFYLLILSSAVITMILTPFSLGLISLLYPKMTGLSPAKRQALQNTCPEPLDEAIATPNSVIIAGYGRVGENLARGLADADIPFEIIDIDPGCIEAAGKCGRPRIYGDATNPHVLKQAGICNASALVIAFPDPMCIETTVKSALALNPQIKILARYQHARDMHSLKSLGVTELINPEYEASFRLLKQLLKISGIEKEDRQAIVDSVRHEGKT
ncbi:MAG: cation:proton antiporter [Dehalococcoidia bacterium]|nr:cation:proton antiporter [Dehalococcoidia bacterium]